MKKVAFIQNAYKVWARVYDGLLDRFFRFDRATVIETLGIQPQEFVLEVGVGTGLNVPYLPPVAKVVGVDLSMAMLRQVKNKLRDSVFIVQGDGLELPFQCDSFDRAVLTYVLRVTPEPHRFLKELSRVCKPGAKLVVLDHFSHPPSWFMRQVECLTQSLGWGKAPDLLTLSENSGWHILSVQPFGMLKGTQLFVLSNNAKVND